MRTRLIVAGLGVLSAVVAAACGSSRSQISEIPDPNAATNDDGGTGIFVPGNQDAKPPCVGLQCKQVDCGGSPSTSLSGIVWDPAGKNPVYNAVVYVPNAPVEPITHGPVCDSCGGAPVSGNPVVTTLTDANGAFKLENVPVGDDIPLVIQVGKWRRQVKLPAAPKACQDNPITNPDLTRLPRNKSEGDMPLIALTTGCDPIHTLMEKIGIDKSEFTTGSGTGSVHVYAGQGATTVVAGATDAYAFWGNEAQMMKYDIIINECECSPYPRDTKGPAYANIKKFLDAGGRVFNSHYHLNFFGSSSENGGKADAELQSSATWTLWSGTSGGSVGPFLIDTSFPKGKAMDDWLTNLATASKWSTPTPLKKTPKGQIQTTNTGDIGGTKPGISQRWIYPSSGAGAVYVSINTPISKPAADRCGRAVGTGLHVGNGSLTTMTEQEAALEFMFFDLASCVIDDAEPPKPPPPK
ncbi:MAG: carboxypeptidase regulatory-like domain-containing protein [Deltaproteobacteria bacterium]|nr:carboxypeptidase regulatory-like domain-containing protein [Deltaproteobacteria bacterium]